MFDKNIIHKNIDNEVLEFFNEILHNFTVESISFYDEWGEFPFIYRERQVNSALIPAIHKYTKSIFLELPFKTISNNQRFLDIVTTKDKNIYLIELKHSYNSKNDTTSLRTDNEWTTAVEQITDIKRSTMKKHYDIKNYNVYKIALMIMPTFLQSNDKHKILKMSSTEYSKLIFDDYQYFTKKYQSNLVGSIKINNYENYIHEYSDRNLIYPFISFIAKIEKL